MKECWRWFGPEDKIALSDLPQVGVQGIVTALHDHPPGVVWSKNAVRQRMDILHTQNYKWDVVESLPVSEAIKTQSLEMAEHIQQYKNSMTNLAQAGIKTICYNFMPILDWTRTELRAIQPHGGTAMSFSLLDFSVFDLFILARPDAKEEYSPEQFEAARAKFTGLSDQQRLALLNNIVAGLPGANDNWTLDDVRNRLETYSGIDAARLRSNLIDFLNEVCPVAENLGIRMCCHPDDPPFELLGLPRVMSSTNDYLTIMREVDTHANGATLCTGSLGVAKSFDPVEFIEKIGERIHFVHLRNTERITYFDQSRPDFFEAPHLQGDTDMVATVKALLAEESRRKAEGREDWEIPMRPDHGQELLGDRTAGSMPGYPLIGRMRGLAELRGLMTGLSA